MKKIIYVAVAATMLCTNNALADSNNSNDEEHWIVITTTKGNTFHVNTKNFKDTDELAKYAEKISDGIDQKHPNGDYHK